MKDAQAVWTAIMRENDSGESPYATAKAHYDKLGADDQERSREALDAVEEGFGTTFWESENTANNAWADLDGDAAIALANKMKEWISFDEE